MVCLLISDSLTVGEVWVVWVDRIVKVNAPFFLPREKVKGGFTLPHEHQVGEPFLGSLCCIALPSLTSLSKPQLDHHPNLLSRQM